MSRAYINEDELFPYFWVTTTDGEYATDVSDYQLADWQHAMAEFRRVQGEMRVAKDVTPS